MSRTFGDYLQQQMHRQDRIGHIARRFGYRRSFRGLIETLLTTSDATCDGDFEAAYEALREFEGERGS